MKKDLIVFSLFCGVLFASAQTTTLTFTGRDVYNNYIRVDRVLIADFAQGWQEIIYYPDTTLTLTVTGIEDFATVNEFGLSQNVPNPFDGVSEFCLSLPNEGAVSIEVLSMDGRQIAAYSNDLPMGIHSFKVKLTIPQTYIVTARFENLSSSIKIVNKGNAGENSLQYTGEDRTYATTVPSAEKGQSANVFLSGDMMYYVGYAIVDGVEYESQVIQKPQRQSENFVLIFNMSIDGGEPCKDMPTVTDIDGNVYRTVQIGSQCWMKDNLRTTHYPNGDSILLYDNGTGWTTTAFRWYPNNDSSTVGTYGYLYNWRAVMNGAASSNASPSGVQGLCPDGWHVPSDAEWTTMFDYVGAYSQYWCGGDSRFIAKALASTFGWNTSQSSTCAVGNDLSLNNATGFNALPAGYNNGNGNDLQFGTHAYFWSSTQQNNDYAYYLVLPYNFEIIIYQPFSKNSPYSVRCLRD